MITKTRKPKTVTIEQLVIENQELREALSDLYAACMAYGMNVSYVLSHPDNDGKHDSILQFLKDETTKQKTKRKNPKASKRKKVRMEKYFI